MRRLWIAVAAAGTLTACGAPAADSDPDSGAGLAAGRVKAGPAVRGAERRRLLAAFNGGVRLVAGAGGVKAGPAVRGAERRRLLAAFNGGFRLSAGAGGYEQEGHLAARLRRGLTSLVIDRSGRPRIGSGATACPNRAGRCTASGRT